VAKTKRDVAVADGSDGEDDQPGSKSQHKPNTLTVLGGGFKRST